MNLGLLITMGSCAIGCSLLESILEKVGKNKEAQLMNLTCTSMLIITATTAVIGVVSAITKLVV